MNEKKKVPLKTWFEDGWFQENFSWRGDLIFNRGLEILQKKGGSIRKGQRKIEGVCFLYNFAILFP